MELSGHANLSTNMEARPRLGKGNLAQPPAAKPWLDKTIPACGANVRLRASRYSGSPVSVTR